MPDQEPGRDQPPQEEKPGAKKFSVEADGVKSEGKTEEPPPRKVLVVEDSKPLRRMLVKILETQGFVATEAEHGKNALAVIKEQGPEAFDLLLVDLMMPVMDGAQFMSEARTTFGDKLPPVLVCSSRSDREAIQLVMKLGVSGYVLKPFKTETVIAKVKEIFAEEAPDES